MKKLITIFFCFFIISNLFASELDKVQELIEIKKYDEALDLLRDLSEDGNIDAHKVLAFIYVNGGYVKQNIRLAILYLNRAVDAGDSRAALTLLNVTLVIIASLQPLSYVTHTARQSPLSSSASL